MARKVDAVIAALHSVLREAERRTDNLYWKKRTVNRWINQLPSAWTGRWRNLKLSGLSWDHSSATRDDLISHVRATLAFLEANRDEIQAIRPWSWPFTRGKWRPETQPIDAQFEEIPTVKDEALGKPPKSVRLIKR
jgi:hypothetical protein